MAVRKGVVEAISHKYDKFAVLIEGNWFNTKKEYADEWPVKPTVGAEITFDDGGKKYLGKMKVLKQGAGAAPSGGSGGSGGGLIGVEIGHASKLAMDMALAAVDNDFEIGSKEFYKFWAEQTLQVHSMMGRLKEKASEAQATQATQAADPAPVVITKAPPVPTPVDDDDDIF